MKFYYAFILSLAFFSTSAFAGVCGFIELANGDLLEVRNSKVYNLDQQLIAQSVPAVKKVTVSSALGSGSIEKANLSSSRKLIKIKFALTGGKTVSTSINQAGSLVFFDAASNSFMWVKLNDGTVFRAALSASSNKLKFAGNEDEFFSPDSCN